MELVQTIVAMVLNILLPLLVQLLDRRGLGAEARERAWNFASWGSALYAFGPLSMLGWYVVTRRGWRRALGVLVAAGLLIVGTLLTALVEPLWLALDLGPPGPVLSP